MGREPERGAVQEKRLLSPALSSLVPREERETDRGRLGDYGAQSAYKIRGILSSIANGREGRGEEALQRP